MIKVYYSHLNDKENIKKLPKNVVNIVSKYNDEKSRKSSAYAWSILNQILLNEYKISLDKTEIYFNENNKPYIKEIYFNISHSNNIIAIAVSDSEVGIDVENENNLKKHLEAGYYKAWLSDIEIEEFEKCKDKLNFITKSWTMKEAILKQKGLGIKINEMRNIYGNVKCFQIRDNSNEKYIISVINSKKDNNEKISIEEIK